MATNSITNPTLDERALNDPLSLVDPLSIVDPSNVTNQNDNIIQINENDNIPIEDDPLAVDNTGTIILDEVEKIDELTTGQIIIVDVDQLKKGILHINYF